MGAKGDDAFGQMQFSEARPDRGSRCVKHQRVSAQKPKANTLAKLLQSCKK